MEHAGLILTGAAALALTAFWAWMLRDAILREPPEGGSRAFWVLVVACSLWLGAAFYFVARKAARPRGR